MWVHQALDMKVQLEHRRILHLHLHTQTCLFKFFSCRLGKGDGILIHNQLIFSTNGEKTNGHIVEVITGRVASICSSVSLATLWWRKEVEWITPLIFKNKKRQVRVWPLVVELAQVCRMVDQFDLPAPIGSSPRCSIRYPTKGPCIFLM